MHYRNIFRVISACSLMAMQAAADGHITTLRLVEDPAIAEASTEPEAAKGRRQSQQAARSVVLTLDTVAGNEYRIQATGNLVSGSWDDIGDVFTATESSTTLSFPENDSHRFFRAVVLTQNIAPAEPVQPPPPGPPPSVPPSTPPI